MIERRGDHRYVLLSRDGERVLGTHRTRRGAETQERAIRISQARAAGHDIPPAPAKNGGVAATRRQGGRVEMTKTSKQLEAEIRRAVRALSGSYR